MDQGVDLCESCSKINVDRLFRAQGLQNEWKGDTSHELHLGRDPNCPLCRFFFDCLLYSNPDDEAWTTIWASSLTLSETTLSTALSLSYFDFFGQTLNVDELRDTPCLSVHGSPGYQFAILPCSAECDEAAKPTFLANTTPESGIDYEFIKEWLAHCGSSHFLDCAAPSSSRLGQLQVIDCISRTLVQIPTGPECGHPYLTLSYVWGSQSTMHPATSSGLPECVPRVIEDAMLVTVELGFRYLWVDRYCIPQDSALEKHDMLQNMGKIYSASEITIIAAGSLSPDDGLQGVSEVKRAPQPSVRVGDGVLACVSPARCRVQVQNSKWNTRGWTYQEALLARRHLVFSESQVYFQCSSTFHYESLRCNVDNAFLTLRPDTTRDGLDPIFPRSGEFSRPEALCLRISEYLQRSLTFDSDSIDAFRGIMASFQASGSVLDHELGIPLYPMTAFRGVLVAHHYQQQLSFAAGLGWYTNLPIVRRIGFPSWSWAGWKLSSVARPTGTPRFFFASALEFIEQDRMGAFMEAGVWFSFSASTLGTVLILRSYAMEIQLRMYQGQWNIVKPANLNRLPVVSGPQIKPTDHVLQRLTLDNEDLVGTGDKEVDLLAIELSTTGDPDGPNSLVVYLVVKAARGAYKRRGILVIAGSTRSLESGEFRIV